jgi:ClpP class serine protease
MITYPQIAARLFNQPLLMPPHRLAPLLSVLGPRLGFDSVMMEGERRPLASLAGAFLSDQASAAEVLRDDDEVQTPEPSGPYATKDGIAIIEITGTLVNRGKWIGEDCGMTSYEGLAHQFGSAYHDPGVRAVLIDVDCGGGEAAGCQALANLIAEVAAKKPVWAAVSDQALSAAYWLASAAGVICLPRLGEVGSIGVWCLHLDQSKQMERNGLVPTLIFAGKHKVDGHPFAALPDDVRADLQASVEDTRTVFAEGVARYRGLGLDAVLATEAKCLTGPAAIQAGLADEILDRYEAQVALTAALDAA